MTIKSYFNSKLDSMNALVDKLVCLKLFLISNILAAPIK